MSYPFSGIANRGPLKWPDDKKVALILTLNLEHWDMTKDTDEAYYAGGPPILPDVLPGRIPDFPNFTWREYGQRVGIWRLFDVFRQAGVA
ncbi:MAG: polysaccharide deacetylase, partial [Rhodospirillaceae bacterium]|nr:polysaccharide deacetylase [Rhodospirillaceae bacterium]